MAAKSTRIIELSGKLQDLLTIEEVKSPKECPESSIVHQDLLEEPIQCVSDHDHDDNETIITRDQLCEVCSQVDFGCVLSANCICHGAEVAGLTVATVLANKTCPSCRLIACLISDSPRQEKIKGETRVRLYSNKYLFARSEQTTTEAAVANQPHWVEVQICNHGLGDNPKQGKDGSIGSLLPYMKHKYYENLEGRSHQGLFSTLQHDGYVFARGLPCVVDVGMLKAWISFCEEKHKTCEDLSTNADDEIRVRFIDVQERRLVESTLKERYLALSYVWGKVTDGVLTNETKDQYQCKDSLNKDTVPRTIFDAMELVAGLGERYLWVDTVCINQDDGHDKQRQLPIMDSIYSRARITIIAAVESADSPLPRWGVTQPITQPRTELLSGIPFTTGQPRLDLLMEQAVWNTRGWTFQEGLLASRALIFTENQVYWNCHEESWTEDRHTEFKNIQNIAIDQNSIVSTRNLASAKGEAGGVWFRELCPFGSYLAKVEQYSTREFRNYSDVVWAFLGILRSMKDDFPGGFIWGLPYEGLDTALLWTTSCVQDRNAEQIVPSNDGTFLQQRIPSWCWIAKGHQVWYAGRCGSTRSRVKWHKPIQYTEDYNLSRDTNGHIKEACSSIFVGPEAPKLAPGLLDFALLNFTAQAASLKLKLDPTADSVKRVGNALKTNSEQLSGNTWVMARIQLQSGRDIGSFAVPIWVFCDGMEEDREFILLSEHVGDCWKCDSEAANEEKDCTHPTELNVMLIEWRKNRSGMSYAVRVAIGRIEEPAWELAGAKEKDIILG